MKPYEDVPPSLAWTLPPWSAENAAPAENFPVSRKHRTLALRDEGQAVRVPQGKVCLSCGHAGCAGHPKREA